MRLSKEELIEQIKYSYEHFSKRLSERYAIHDLAYTEYIELYKKPFLFMYRLSEKKTFGIIEIRGIEVYAIRDTDYKVYATCLTEPGKYPLPIYVRRRHVTSEQFQEDIRKIELVLDDLVRHYESIGRDSKEFFTKPLVPTWPRWIYSAAFFKANTSNVKKTMYLHKLLWHLYMEPNQFITLPKNILKNI